ncbi:tRNA (guanine(46)-N(7))-methyltransferase TrmB [Sneathiella limimaris]|uniref:tRNA (guanine(46)-N(7))-methyltransferase TrmB n=1 Tax=Sneathiella limimaris TaxID=1964213 RepID=UPI00146E3780|nr:tRNA (guanine(46)-N(7))-methyltransferase TrmB [Sneathiella limimaris]
MTPSSEHRKRILYGRRRGKALRKGQQEAVDALLPQMTVPIEEQRLIDLPTLFEAPKKEYWLEIGFGAGEHLAWQAEHHSEAGIIGCEPFLNGVASLLGKVQEKQLTNVRVHNEAAELLMEKLPERSLDKLFLLFADPWPKSSHHKRRFVSNDNLQAIARILKDDAIVRVGTDHTDYGAWILHHFLQSDKFEWMAEHPEDWTIRGEDWPQTRYEAKALREGRRSVYYRFRRVKRSN